MEGPGVPQGRSFRSGLLHFWVGTGGSSRFSHVHAVFVHALCGLLRKTGARTPAGPFRRTRARQWSGHGGASLLQNQRIRTEPRLLSSSLRLLARETSDENVSRASWLPSSSSSSSSSGSRCVDHSWGSMSVQRRPVRTQCEGDPGERQLDHSWIQSTRLCRGAGCAYASLAVRAPDRSHMLGL